MGFFEEWQVHVEALAAKANAKEQAVENGEDRGQLAFWDAEGNRITRIASERPEGSERFGEEWESDLLAERRASIREAEPVTAEQIVAQHGSDFSAPELNNMGAESSQIESVSGGIDALDIAVYGDFNAVTIQLNRAHLSRSKQKAQENHEPQLYRMKNGKAAYLRQSGAGSGFGHTPFVLEYEGCVFRLTNRPSSTAGEREMPIAFFESKSNVLMARGPGGVIESLAELLAEFDVTVSRLDVRRCDVCVDLVDVPVSKFGKAFTSGRFISRQRAGRLHVGNDGQITGVEVGRRGSRSIFMRAYDKILELNRRDDEFKKSLMIMRRYGGEWPSVATRVEFEIGRDKLRELGVRTLKDLRSKLADMCRYLTHDFLRFTSRKPDKANKNHSRYKTSPNWVAVQNAFAEWTGEPIDTINTPCPVTAVSGSQMMRQALGTFAAAFARVGIMPGCATAFRSAVSRTLSDESVSGKALAKIRRKREQLESGSGFAVVPYFVLEGL